MSAWNKHGFVCVAVLTTTLLATAGACGERPENSRGRIVDSSQRPWQAIGRVNVSGVRFCTGTLVAPDMVLTAAHCLNNRVTGKRHLPEYVTFLIGYSRGSYAATSKAVSFSIENCAPKDSDISSLAELACDIALVKLATPIRNVEPLQQATSVPESGDEVLAGYLQSRPYALSIIECSIFPQEQESSLLYHSCGWIEGGSGGPLLTKADGTWRVFGIQTAKGKQPDGTTIGFGRRWIVGD
jgi:protease YdgD